MDHNLALLELANANDRRVFRRWRKDQAKDSQWFKVEFIFCVRGVVAGVVAPEEKNRKTTRYK
jgi:hypothetical protein